MCSVTEVSACPTAGTADGVGGIGCALAKEGSRGGRNPLFLPLFFAVASADLVLPLVGAVDR